MDKVDSPLVIDVKYSFQSKNASENGTIPLARTLQ